MPVYEFKCTKGHEFEVVCSRDDVEAWTRQLCPIRDYDVTPCFGGLKRKYSVRFNSVMQEHYNHSVGKPISSMRQFRDELKRSSEHASERTGITHDFQPADPNEGMED